MFRCVIPLALSILLFAVSATAGSNDFTSIYFAPETRVSFKTVEPGGGIRRFDGGDPSKPGQIMSSDGWTATFGDGGRVTVESPEAGKAKAVWEFDRGRIIAHGSGDERKTIQYETPRAAPEGVLTPLAYYEFTPEYLKEQQDRALEGKWDGTGRLCFPYENPNHSGALYCHLALLALAVLLACRGKVRVVAASAFIAFFACLVLTGSRGSLVGFAVGLAAFFAFRFRSLIRSRAFWAALAVGVAAIVCWFGWLHSDQLLRGFADGRMDWSNAIRVDMLKVAPKMMVDAPGGWGFVGAGRAYFDWYQPLDNLFMTGSLMNDHLTILADAGWLGRFAYLFALLSLLLLSCSYARRGKGGFPLSVLTATVAMSCFNPMFAKIGLWAVPVVAAGLLAFWCFRTRGRCLILPVVVSACAAGGLVAVLFWIGSAQEPVDGLRVFATGRQVCVRGKAPAIWIVDDTQGALGGIFASKDTGTLSVVGVVAQAVTEEPRLVAVVVLIVEIDLQLLHTRLQEVEVPTLGVRPRGADEFQRGIFGTQGSIELLQALGKHRAVATMGLVVVPLLIADAEVFQVEGRRMAHVGAYLTPFGIHRTVGKLYEVEGILDIRVEIV